MNHTFGLSTLPPGVARRVTTTYGHHRTPWFEGILQDIAVRLRPALGNRFTPLFLTTTALGAREAVVSNLIRPSDRVLATPGSFVDLAGAWGARTTPLTTGTAPHSLDVPPDAVFIEHVPASGALLDARGIIQSVRTIAPGAPVVLDASISFGADVADLAGLDADAVLIAPDRALMGIPGVMIVAVTERFLEVLRAVRPSLLEKPFLFDLLKHHRAWSKHTTPFSPNISACVALQAALDEIDGIGGLLGLAAHHRLRAATVRRSLACLGATSGPDTHTHAWTTVALAGGRDPAALSSRLRRDNIDARAYSADSSSVQIAHAGYMPESALARLHSVVTSCAEPELPSHIVVSQEGTTPIEAPFTIASAEFVEQSNTLASRASTNPQVAAIIARNARQVFRENHVVHPDALRYRRIGFVGAGRIVRIAVDLCRARGVPHLTVYSPSLAEALSSESQTLSERHPVTSWRQLGVDVAPTVEELFETCHTVVLLPVVYDDVALRLFRKPPRYANKDLVSAALLERAERAGRLDLIVNAAARGALVDRAALTREVARGWLRYYSDEMPADNDPLLDRDNVRFTAHVGGSCRAPQAAVARNTHTILRRVLGALLERNTADEDSSYQPSVVNAHLCAGRQDRCQSALQDVVASGTIRVLLTDRFDVESLAFDRLRDLGVEIDVQDISAGPTSPARLSAAVESFRPHVVMLRSRTRVDAEVAQSMIAASALAFIVRPGVGVDNIYGGMEQLSAAGIQVINEPYGNSRAVAEMTLHFILSGTETTLLAPGPTNFNAQVFDVAESYDETRLHQPFAPAAAIDRTLGSWLGAPGRALTMSGPGTALMEASIASLTMPGDRGLILSHGKFGDRFVEIAAARGRECEVLQVPEENWGAAITVHDVERFLQQDDERRARTGEPPIAFVCFQQNETSSGVTYHQPAIRALVDVARAYNPRITIIADAISGALAHRLEFDALDLDMLFLGSQKALGVSAGLAFAVLSARALDAMATRSGQSGGFDALCSDPQAPGCLEQFDRLHRVHSTSLLRAAVAGRARRYVDTPSLFHLLCTERALQLLRAQGDPEAVAARHAELAQLVRDGVRGLGLGLMPVEPFESDSVTVVLLPVGIDASAIRKLVAQNSAIAIAGAQGDYWKPRMLRIGTLGFVTRSDVARCIRALRAALVDVGYRPAPADAVTLNAV